MAGVKPSGGAGSYLGWAGAGPLRSWRPSRLLLVLLLWLLLLVLLLQQARRQLLDERRQLLLKRLLSRWRLLLLRRLRLLLCGWRCLLLCGWRRLLRAGGWGPRRAPRQRAASARPRGRRGWAFLRRAALRL